VSLAHLEPLALGPAKTLRAQEEAEPPSSSAAQRSRASEASGSSRPVLRWMGVLGPSSLVRPPPFSAVRGLVLAQRLLEAMALGSRLAPASVPKPDQPRRSRWQSRACFALKYACPPPVPLFLRTAPSAFRPSVDNRLHTFSCSFGQSRLLTAIPRHWPTWSASATSAHQSCRRSASTSGRHAGLPGRYVIVETKSREMRRRGPQASGYRHRGGDHATSVPR